MATQIKRENFSNIYGKGKTREDTTNSLNAKRSWGNIVDLEYESDEEDKKPRLEGRKVVVDNPEVDQFLINAATAIESNNKGSDTKTDTFPKHEQSNVLKFVREDKGDVNSGDQVHLASSDNNNIKTRDDISKSSKQISENLVKDETQPSSTAKSSQGSAAAKALNEAPLKDCPERGSKLVGPLFIDEQVPSPNDEKSLSIDYGGSVEKGGWWAPTTCIPKVKVAIIIPYRNREKQLKIFLHHMHPILQRQQLFYRIIVVEQLSDDPFNRAGLFNIGFVESMKISPFNCFVFSDVDLLPEDDRNYYGCHTSPRHMSVAVDKFNYQLPYATIFGGVGSFTKNHFEEINGMSNLFWGWGGEDDDLYQRITSQGLALTRPSIQLGRYTMIKIHHFQSSQADPNRMNLLRNSKQRMIVDGLNTLKYHLKEVIEEPLVTFVKIEMKKRDYFQ